MLYGQHHAYRAMIGSGDVIINEGIFDPALFHQILRNDKIIDPPSDISGSGAEPVGPPGILCNIRVQISERVHVAVLKNAVHPVPFDPKKAGIILIGLGVFQIDFIVSRIEIAADDHASALEAIAIGMGKKTPHKS